MNSNNTCPSSNGTSDSTVKNILDARRSSTTKSSSSSSSSSPPTSLYHYQTNETKFPTPIINTLTSPNENLLHLSSSTTIKPMDILDYSLNNSRTTNGGQYHHSSSLHPSRWWCGSASFFSIIFRNLSMNLFLEFFCFVEAQYFEHLSKKRKKYREKKISFWSIM